MKAFLKTGLLLCLSSLLLGCAASRPTRYVDRRFDFGSIERIAVIPFENLSSDPSSGKYVTRILITELLAQEVFEIVEPGEVTAYLSKQSTMRADELSIAQMQDLGKALNVQGIVFGTVGESGQFRSGNLSTHVVSLDIRMVSVENGATVWSSVVNTNGPGFFSRLMGTGEQTRGKVVRSAVRRAIKTLVH
jgi:TolB-like protein